MKRILFTVAFLMTVVCSIYSQDKQIVIMTANDYGQQTWFYNGKGNELQTAKIKENYDQDYYITSVSYTANGWFVAMSKNPGFTGQSYKYTSDWPTDWICEKEKDGYYITSIAHGNGKWMFVVSKGTGYTDQTWKWDTWKNIKPYIDKNWDLGYRITQAEYMNGKWLIFMHKNTQYAYQNWSTRSTYETAKERISQYWKDGKRLQLLEYGDGCYLIIASTLKSGKVLAQSYSTNSSGTSDYISEKWNEGKKIAYIGGGYNSQSKTTRSNTTTYANNNNNNHNNNGGKKVLIDATVPFMNGTSRHIIYSDGSGYSEDNFPCTSLHCINGRCTMCNGTGIAVHPYLGTTLPCTICNMGRCKYCNGQGRIKKQKHWAPGEAQAYLQAKRQLENAGHHVPEPNKSHSKSGVCPDCNGHGYRPQAYTYAASSSFAPYHNSSGNICPICNRVTDHYHYRCTTCKKF